MRTTSTTRSAAGPTGSAVPACPSGRRPTRARSPAGRERVRPQDARPGPPRLRAPAVIPGGGLRHRPRVVGRFGCPAGSTGSDRDGGRVEIVENDTKRDANVDLGARRRRHRAVQRPDDRVVRRTRAAGRRWSPSGTRPTTSRSATCGSVRIPRARSRPASGSWSGTRPAPAPGAREPARRCARGPRQVLAHRPEPPLAARASGQSGHRHRAPPARR